MAATKFVRLRNGQFRIKTAKQAQEALELVLELQEKVSELEAKHGIKEMRDDAVELKKAATGYMDTHNVDVFKMEDGRIARLVRSYTGRWIGTKADALQDGLAVKSLRSIVGKEMWMKISKRVPDPDRINEAVGAGLLKEDEISKAYVEEPRAPYVRFFDG